MCPVFLLDVALSFAWADAKLRVGSRCAHVYQLPPGRRCVLGLRTAAAALALAARELERAGRPPGSPRCLQIGQQVQTPGFPDPVAAGTGIGATPQAEVTR